MSLAPTTALPTTSFAPRELGSIQETGLTQQFLTDLVLKVVYYATKLTGYEVAQRVKLPFVGIIDQILDSLRQEGALEVQSGTAITSASYMYAVTGKGTQRAGELVDRSSYAGPAPVSMEDYWRSVQGQSVVDVVISREQMHEAYRHMVVSESLLDQLGPAINAADSIFLFGPPGNGKTTIAETAAKLLGGEVYIPYAIEYDSQVIRVYDEIFHTSLEAEEERVGTLDRRWVKAKRPMVVVGGELTMRSLDPVYSQSGRYYEAPLQLKANCGMFLIDDFGRQQVSPRELLNRWIVPLEKRKDFLILRSGHEVAVPFDQLIVFSTNLDPTRLVDEAFLRRIRYKIRVPNPTLEQYDQIFQRICQARGVPYDPAGVQFVLDYCNKRDIGPRNVHPRDLIDHLQHIAEYLRVPPVCSPALLEAACTNYFVNTKEEE